MRGKLFLQRARIGHAVVKDAGSQRSVCSAMRKYIHKVLHSARTPGCNDGNLQRAAEERCQLAVKAVACAVCIHGRQQNFSRAALFGFTRPVEDELARWLASAADVDLRLLRGDALR